MNLEISLPENEPVRLASAQLEELDYTNLYKAYSSKGRKSAVDPRVMFKVMVYGYQWGIYSSRKLEEACRSTGWISCGCWRKKMLRITPHLLGSGQAAALRR